MKQILFVLLLIGTTISAQKPGELKTRDRFLGYSYLIGEKDVSPKEVQLHLNQYDTEAAYLFRRARDNDRAGTIWSLIGLGGVLGALAFDDPGAAFGSSLVGVVGFSGALVCVLKTNSNSKKARQHYNIKYGY